MEILQYNDLIDYSKYIFNNIYTDYSDIQDIFNRACIKRDMKTIKSLLITNLDLDIKQGLSIAIKYDNIKLIRLLIYYNKN